MDKDSLITLAADIVSAYVGNNIVSVNDLPILIRSVHQSLSTVGEPAPVAEAKREPAVPIRASVKPDAVTCLDCGFKAKMLKRHILTEHGLAPQEYKARWNLSADHPLVAPNYAAKRAELARTIGLGRKTKAANAG